MYLRAYVLCVYDLITWLCELVCEGLLSVVYEYTSECMCVSEVCARARVSEWICLYTGTAV